MSSAEPDMVREAVGVFRSEKALQSVIDDLLASGFDRADLSLLSSMASVRAQPGHSRDTVKMLEDDRDVQTMGFISHDSISEAQGAVFSGFFYVGAMAALVPVIVSGGALAAALMAVGLGGGAGGAIGALLARVIGQQHATAMEDQLAGGGLVLWVRTWNRADEQRTVDILTRHSGSDIHLHGLTDQPFERKKRDPASTLGTFVSVYHGHTYTNVDDNGYMALGALFPNENGVKAFIDRHNSLEAITAAAEACGLDVDAVWTHPSAMFETPDKLIATALPDSLKIEILKRWAYGEKELEAATDEGMPPVKSDHRLQQVENAILQLTAKLSPAI